MRKLSANKLSPRQVADVVNAVAPGTITERQVRYQVQTATHRLGTAGKIHLLFYIAWLRSLLLGGERLKGKDERSQAEIMRERRAEGRDIGEIPEAKNPERRESCRRNLAKFLRTYMPGSFPLEFSADHLHVIQKIEQAILEGGLFAEAVFRGFGKTTIAIGAAIWVAVYGHKKFIPIINADKAAGVALIQSIQVEFEENDLLLEDFPAAAFPLRELEGIAHRCPGQTYNGERTHVELRKDTLVLPTIPGAESAGVVIKSFGLTGRLRGMQHKRPDGAVVRPDFTIIDDPQTDVSARSPSQCDTREKLITGAVLGLAGHSQKMSAVMPCTVIKKGDLVDRLLDHKMHPEWQGDKLPMVKKWADAHDDLWLKEYAELRRRDYSDAEGGRSRAVKEASDFYRKNRAAMDAGAVVSWEHCKEPGELSAIQHAYNLLIDRGFPVFMAEFQLDPPDEFEGIEKPLEPGDIMRKTNNLPRFTADHGASTIVAFIDCGSTTHLHWMVCWFGAGFSGGVLDYGKCLVERTNLGGVEAALTTALVKTTSQICGRAYPVSGGGELRVGLCLIDSGWQTRTVYQFCRQSQFAAMLAPSKGQGGELELRAPKICPRSSQGDGWYHWHTVKRDARLLMYNTDHFKSFASERLRTPLGGSGCVTLWGSQGHEHRAIAEHLTSERPESKTKKTGDVFAKWTVLPGRANHGWDCLVGCHVAAARQGITLEGLAPVKAERKAYRFGGN